MPNSWKPGDPERRENVHDQIIEIEFIKRMISGVGAVLVVQLIGAIWWASSMTTSMEYVKLDMSTIKAQIASSSDDRYRGSDAKKDLSQVYDRISRVEEQQKVNTERIIELQSRKR